MTDATLTSANIRPLNGAIVRQFAANAELTVGNVVYIASDGEVDKADCNAALTSIGVGIVVASRDGQTTIAAGEAASVVVLGPVGGFSGLVEGSRMFVSEVAGGLRTAAPTGAGTWSHCMGYAERDGVFFVLPGFALTTSNS